MVFSSRMVSEVVQPFWDALQRGEFITGAAESVGSYRVQGRRWMVAARAVDEVLRRLARSAGLELCAHVSRHTWVTRRCQGRD